MTRGGGGARYLGCSVSCENISVPSGKKSRHRAPWVYTQAGRSEERVRFERPTGALYVPVRQEGSRRIVPRPTYTNLFIHSRTMQPRVLSTHEPDHSPRENPRVSWTVYWTSNTSCLARLVVRGATYAWIRPYTCNYFGQSVPVKSHASSYIYRSESCERHGIRCRFTTVPSIFGML